MSDGKTPTDAEFSAMQTLYSALEPLDNDARIRVVDYIAARLKIAVKSPERPSGAGVIASNGGDGAAIEEEERTAPKYKDFADLYAAARPKNQADKALVAGYWLQVCQGAENFDGFSANRELRHLGERVGNITNAVDNLKDQKPELALQLKKSGKSQQARKVYKLTVAGIKAVEAMIDE
jgi:hypothetical protein